MASLNASFEQIPLFDSRHAGQILLNLPLAKNSASHFKHARLIRLGFRAITRFPVVKASLKMSVSQVLCMASYPLRKLLGPSLSIEAWAVSDRWRDSNRHLSPHICRNRPSFSLFVSQAKKNDMVSSFGSWVIRTKVSWRGYSLDIEVNSAWYCRFLRLRSSFNLWIVFLRHGSQRVWVASVSEKGAFSPICLLHSKQMTLMAEYLPLVWSLPSRLNQSAHSSGNFDAEPPGSFKCSKLLSLLKEPYLLWRARQKMIT